MRQQAGTPLAFLPGFLLRVFLDIIFAPAGGGGAKMMFVCFVPLDWWCTLLGMKSLLYHGFGIKGYRHLATRYQGGEIIFAVEPEDLPPAPEKGHLVRHGFRWRKVRSLSIGFKPVWLKVKVLRWRNPETGEEFEQSPPLSPKGPTWPERSKISSSS